MNNDIVKKAVNTMRVLAIEAIQKANSGHPGIALGAAPIMYAVMAENMVHNPKNPNFNNRDRFVLSAGHGSSLLYSCMHLLGFDISKEDLKNFRQLNSKTPGHPEYNVTKGVETSTGPLGQGIANAVGMAISETFLASIFNKPKFNVVDHYTYTVCGDGCLMEGISYEAAALAGTLKLNKLILLYDRNNITIEGDINTSFDENIKDRFIAQNWFVTEVKNGDDVDEISAAIKKCKAQKEKPSIIIVNTHIGFGSPLVDSADCHGAPLGVDNVEKTKKALGINAQPFEADKDVLDFMETKRENGQKAENEWLDMMKRYEKEYPELFKQYNDFMEGKLPEIINGEELWSFTKPDATRGTSSTILNKLSKVMPNLFGGSADLAPSNKTIMNDRKYYSSENRSGSNMHFGIREHAMGAIVNGMYLHGGVRPYCSTFFVFSDYMKNAMRMSALMKLPVIYIMTHDSIGVGEDGPTHQPIEQLTTLRSVPNMNVFRPADGRETAAAWISALTGDSPTCLVLSRQNLPDIKNSGKGALKGAYVVEDSKKSEPDLIIMASGSELSLAIKAKEELDKEGIDTRIVSVPCQEIFDKQEDSYKEKILPKKVKNRISIEAGSSMCWYKYIGLDGKAIAVDHFGESAPADVLFDLYGFNVENVVKQAKAMMNK